MKVTRLSGGTPLRSAPLARQSRASLPLVTLALALGWAGAGCDQVRKPVPPDPGGLPPLAAEQKVAGKPQGAAEHQISADHPALPADHPALPADHPALPADHPALPADHPALPADHPALAQGGDADGRIAGVIKLDDKVRSKILPSATLFLVARAASPGGTPGPILAVKKMNVGVFPQSFELTGDDVMIQGSALKGQVILTARVDQDGDAMTKEAGDIEGATRPITVGNDKVELLLDTVRTQAAGAPSPPGMGAAMDKPPGHL